MPTAEARVPTRRPALDTRGRLQFLDPMGDQVTVVALSNVPVDWLIWQRPPNAPVLTIVCRATFVLQPGEALLASEQEPLTLCEQPYPDGSSHGVYAPSDLIPMKPRADVVLVGQAFAPGRQPVRSLVARLAVGEMEKRIEIFGDRQFDLQGALIEGPRFTIMPLVYERAAGGPDTANPIGVRPHQRDQRGRLTLPNLQPTGLEIATFADPIAPVGFGPIASEWPSRRALFGPAATGAASAEWQRPLVPPGLDPSYFHAAPQDQQVQALRGDEQIVLGNLHPQHSELVTRLPGVRPRTFVEGRGGAPQAVTMRADTLWIDTSRQIFTVTWRGQLPLDPPAPGLRVLVALEWPDRPLVWEDIERMRSEAHAAAQGEWDGTETIAAMMGPRSPILPFAALGASVGTPREPVSGGGLPFRHPGDAPSAPLLAPPPLKEGDTLDELALTLAPSLIEPMPLPLLSQPAPIVSQWARGGPGFAAPPPSVWSEPVRDVASPQITVQSAAAHPAPTVRPYAAPSPSHARAVAPLHLVWFEPESLPYLRKDPRFSPILDALEERPLDSDLDDPDLAADVADLDERRETFEILARGSAIGEEGVIAALAGAVRDDGRLVQPLVLVAGELVFAFDGIEALKAMISSAAPYTGMDLEAKAILDLAKEFLGSPGQPSAPAVAEGLAMRIRETFETRSLLPTGFLDVQTERALLRGRHYQQRAVLGGPHVRALLHAGSGHGIPTYLAREVAAKLPAVERLRTRILALVHPIVDQHETHPAALRVIALGVVNSPLARR